MTTILLQTTQGDTRIDAFEDPMPVTAGNFRKLVQEGSFNATIFHRVFPDFMVQGGDPSGTGTGGLGLGHTPKRPRLEK